jgi:hypothetical protein
LSAKEVGLGECGKKGLKKGKLYILIKIKLILLKKKGDIQCRLLP